MKQVYHAQTTYVDEWELHPKLGATISQKRVLQDSGTMHVTASTGEGYERQEDGTFLLPDEVANHLLRQPNWHEGANPLVKPRPAPTGPRVRRADEENAPRRGRPPKVVDDEE